MNGNETTIIFLVWLVLCSFYIIFSFERSKRKFKELEEFCLLLKCKIEKIQHMDTGMFGIFDPCNKRISIENVINMLMKKLNLKFEVDPTKKDEYSVEIVEKEPKYKKPDTKANELLIRFLIEQRVVVLESEIMSLSKKISELESKIKKQKPTTKKGK